MSKNSIYFKFRRKIRHYLLPIFWPCVSLFFRKIFKNSKLISPDHPGITNSIVLTSGSESEVPGIDLTKALVSWLADNLNLKTSLESSVSALFRSHTDKSENTVLIISYDWLVSDLRWKYFGLINWIIAIKARRAKVPIWILLTDPFDVEYLPFASAMVSIAGGSVVLQTNTVAEALRFGIINPSGPYIWTMPMSEVREFESNLSWETREKNALLAGSGEPRRLFFMHSLGEKLLKSQWKVNYSDQSLGWLDYVESVKSAQLVATTCWMQQIHKRGPKFVSRRVADTTLTHRVLEGFASKAVVITSKSSVLDWFGFESGVHYLLLGDEQLEGLSQLVPDTDKLKDISDSGNKHFLSVINRNL